MNAERGRGGEIGAWVWMERWWVGGLGDEKGRPEGEGDLREWMVRKEWERDRVICFFELCRCLTVPPPAAPMPIFLDMRSCLTTTTPRPAAPIAHFCIPRFLVRDSGPRAAACG